jgi:hypothetical protein
LKRGVVLALTLSLAACTSGSQPQTAPSPDATVSARVDERFGWTPGSEVPTPRTEVAVAAQETLIFVAGGFTEDGKASDLVEVYESADANWTTAPALPEPLHHAALAAAFGRVYVMGGYRANGSASARVWSLNFGGELRSGEWKREPDMPTARGALAAGVVGRRIHAVGGASGFGGSTTLVGAHEAYDIRTRKWEKLPDLPDPRDHLAAAGDGGKLYVVGGRKLSLTTNSARLDIFDPATGRWTRGPDMPTARGGLAAAAHKGHVFVFGGEEPEGTFEEAEIYEIAKRQWTRAPDLPTPRHGLGAAANHAGWVHVMGGGPEPGLTVSGAHETLRLKDR